MITYCCERPEDAGQIELLLDKAFGPGRFAKTAYRLREGVSFIPELSMVALEDGVLCGSLRYWPIEIGEARTKAILLGPLVVDPELQGQGIAFRLMEDSLEKARAQGHKIVVLVGDEPYYTKVGFSAQAARGLRMPGPVDPTRLLARELSPGALNGVGGLISRARVRRDRTADQPIKKRAARL